MKRTRKKAHDHDDYTYGNDYNNDSNDDSPIYYSNDDNINNTATVRVRTKIPPNMLNIDVSYQ